VRHPRPPGPWLVHGAVRESIRSPQDVDDCAVNVANIDSDAQHRSWNEQRSKWSSGYIGKGRSPRNLQMRSVCGGAFSGALD
jgi:hypothetical protein